MISSFPEGVRGASIVLSGGGARGAYEVGVLRYIFKELAVRIGRPPSLDLISGTSVGAVNGTFMAAAAHDLALGAVQLETLWSELEMASVMNFGLKQAASLHRVLLGGKSARGLFDASPLVRLVQEGVSWRQLGDNLRTGILRALVITTTRLRTGRSVVFLDQGGEREDRMDLPDAVSLRRSPIGPSHVLASAAIPIVFPPIRIGDELHCDGGLRLNTPMSPSIHLGASRLLVIGVSSPEGTEPTPLKTERYPGASFLLGKVLNAFLLDHLKSDLAELDRVNRWLKDGIEAFGPGYIDELNKISAQRGEPPRRIVEACAIHPSTDLGVIASHHLRSSSVLRASMGRSLIRLLDVGESADADLASYLLFDGNFARELIALGRRDAHERRDELEAFLYEGY